MSAPIQATLEKWVTRERVRSEHCRNRTACSLYDSNGLAMLPWIESGYSAVAIRTEEVAYVSGVEVALSGLSDERAVETQLGALGDLAFIFAIPPCADLCSAGARWWRKKRARNPNFQHDAAQQIIDLRRLLSDTGIPFCMVLPASSVVKRLVGVPDLTFHPHEYGGYLSKDAEHPLFPEVVPVSDRYTKRSFAYVGNGAVLPFKKSLAPRFTTIALKNGKTKRVSPVLASRRTKHTRSLVPLGFATALCALNSA